MCFLFFQANLILVPFPTHRKQVPSITNQFQLYGLYLFTPKIFLTLFTVISTAHSLTFAQLG